jgi:hypothetical protein
MSGRVTGFGFTKVTPFIAGLMMRMFSLPVFCVTKIWVQHLINLTGPSVLVAVTPSTEHSKAK